MWLRKVMKGSFQGEKEIFVHNSKKTAYANIENTDNLLKKFKKVIDKSKSFW